ncbi:MAG: chalcone isomerase family protein [Myxococcaceae bacterium]
MTRRTFGGAVLALAALAIPAPAEARQVGGMKVPERTVVEGHVLELKGAALQEKLWFDVYGIALYLTEPLDTADAIIDADQVKQLRLYILRNLPGQEVRKALLAGFQNAAPDDFETLRPRVNEMLRSIQDVHEGERIVMTYVPGTGTILRAANGTRLTIPGEDFARALFAIWLGPNTDTPHLREQLLAP